MNEWIHIAISGAGTVIGVLLGLVLREFRGRIDRIEQQGDETAEAVAYLKGRLKLDA